MLIVESNFKSIRGDRIALGVSLVIMAGEGVDVLPAVSSLVGVLNCNCRAVMVLLFVIDDDGKEVETIGVISPVEEL